uniref:Uncharacterized protein n=1 Tax=Anguilla anguilla TaxID=7936 RepID=A0A0E9V170_ANGAN
MTHTVLCKTNKRRAPKILQTACEDIGKKSHTCVLHQKYTFIRIHIL